MPKIKTKRTTAEKSDPIAKKETKGKKKAAKSKEVVKVDKLFKAKPKNFTIGQDIQPKRDLSRFVKFPRYVQIQRKRSILYRRLKVPPMLNQFSFALDKNMASKLFKLAYNYRPEDKVQKRLRLKKVATAEKTEKAKKPNLLKYGLNHVTNLIEKKKTSLVVIAHDVNPVELVVWLPTLCVKMDVPYCIVKGKARLGQLVHLKNAAVVAFPLDVNPEDKQEFSKLIEAVRSQYNDQYSTKRKQWGGMKLSNRSNAKIAKASKRANREGKK